MSPVQLEQGVWGVLATPFSGSRFDVDEASLISEVELYRDLGVTGLVALGVFGEAAALDSEEQRAVVETVDGARDGLPLVVGLAAQATAPAIAQAQLALDAAGDGLAAVMVQVNTAAPPTLTQHLAAVHDATGAGVVVQDYPLVTGVRIPPEALARVVANCDFVVAVKAESPPTPPAVSYLATHVEVPVFGGLGGLGLIDELAAGAAGAMTGFSFPEGLMAATAAYHDGGFAAAREAFAPWLPLVNFEAQAGIGLAIRKEGFRQRGVFMESSVRPPAAAMPDALLPLLERHLETVPVARH